MLLSTSREILLKPLMLVSGFIEKKQTMPILSHVYIRRDGATLTVIANDSEIQACITSAIDTNGEDFIITLPGKKLQDILKVIPENSEVKLNKQDNKVVIKAGKLKYTIQSLPAEHYPLLKISDKMISEFMLEQAQLKLMLWQIQYAMADKDSRVFLNGMLFEVKNNQLRMIATDAHRLGMSSINLIQPQKSDYSVIIPRKTILELFRILENTTTPITVKVFPNQVYFECGDKQLITKVIDGKYPDYERVIPLSNDKICLVNRLSLLNAVDRVSVIGSEKTKTVTVEVSENMLTLSCRNEDQEDSLDEVEVHYNGSPIKISFNLQYLRDLLTNSIAENLQLALFDSQRSVLVTIPDEPNFKAVIMPLRI
jgi:DNA polymerase-3 subunit beta